MSRERLLELLNGGIIDTHFLFEQYIQNGGGLDYNIFIQVLPMYAQRNGGIEALYKGLMIEHSVHKVFNMDGILLKYY